MFVFSLFTFWAVGAKKILQPQTPPRNRISSYKKNFQTMKICLIDDLVISEESEFAICEQPS